MKTNKVLFLGVLMISFFTSCTVADEEDNTNATDASGNVVSKVDNGTITATDSMNFRMLLTDSVSKQWSTSLFTLAGSSVFTNCRLDDVMLIFKDGTYSYQGGQLCGAEDNMMSRNGSWELDYSNKKIVFDRGSSNEYIAEVIGLLDNELRVKGSYMGMEVRGLYKTN